MTKGRLEAFTDGVVAIIITIMVLELKTPAGFDLKALTSLWPTFAMYAMSFVYVGIYWNNHHHMMHAVHRINGAVLWANMHLLFWLSLVPFTTRWMGESWIENPVVKPALPFAVYGVSLIMPAIAYTLLVRALIAANGKDSLLARAIGADWKGYVSLVFYAVGIGLSFWNVLAALACYATVAAIWFLPDRRIEKKA
ncbi:MAG: TMEM175 family protein [Asticcacaulis sp.]